MTDKVTIERDVLQQVLVTLEDTNSRLDMRRAIRAAIMAKQPVPLTDRQILDIAEPFGCFEYGDAQGHKRIEFARAVLAAAGGKL